jgi:hypothetical protein
MNLNLGDTQAIIAEGKKRGVLRNQLAYILATSYWETGKTMKPVEEAYYLGKAAQEAYLKKKKYYPWYGRGYVQLTWESNYKQYGITNPDDALNSSTAMNILFDGMLNGKFTGRRLDRYVNLQKSNFASARQVVNKLDEYVKIAAIAKEYDGDLKAIGYGEENPEPVEDDTVEKESTAIKLLRLILKLITEYLESK